jgi:surface protein
MKKLLLLFIMILSTVSYSQTAITDANFRTAINTCLRTNPVDGMCTGSEFGAMPDWDVSNVTTMQQAGFGENFNGDISSWDVSSVINMASTFNGASSFNQDISSWDVSSVINMERMFWNAVSFNQPIGVWDTSSVTKMHAMFYVASSFNQDYGASSFNQDISSWDVSSVTDMSYMFYLATSFKQDISNWCVTNIASEPSEFGLPQSNKPVWGTCPTASVDN